MYFAQLFASRFLSLLYVISIAALFFTSQAGAADYILGPGDVVKITVYDNEDLLTISRISDDGNIIMPLLGQVKVEGLSVSQTSVHIGELLSDGYIINPQVNIFVQEFRSKKAIVLGQVNRPGIIEMSGPISFLELLSKAGGLAPDFGETATVKRKESDSIDVIPVNLKSLVKGGDLSQNILIRDGDTVYVSKADMCYVTGQVKAQNAYKCSGNLTVLKLITLAGGFTERASKSSVRIIRIVNGEKTVYEDVDLDMKVQPDDIIIIPESFF